MATNGWEDEPGHFSIDVNVSKYIVVMPCLLDFKDMRKHGAFCQELEEIRGILHDSHSLVKTEL